MFSKILNIIIADFRNHDGEGFKSFIFNYILFNILLIGNFVLENLNLSLSSQYVDLLRSLVARVQNVKILVKEIIFSAAPINVFRWNF